MTDQDNTTPEGQAADPVAEYEKKIPPGVTLDEAHEAAKEQRTERPRVIFKSETYTDDVGHVVEVKEPVVNKQYARPGTIYFGQGGMSIRTPEGAMPHTFKFPVEVEEDGKLRPPRDLAEAFEHFEASGKRGAEKEIEDIKDNARKAALHQPPPPGMMDALRRQQGGRILGPDGTPR